MFGIRSLDVELVYASRKLLVNGEEIVPSVRRLKDMLPVLYDRSFVNDSNREDVLYRMFRGVGTNEVFKEHKVRFDITVMEDYPLGKEYNKTFGHYHPVAIANLSYPEIYEVLEGSAVFLLQSKSGTGYEAKLIEAKAGDKVLMLPNYGHITINTGKGLLVLANLVSSAFESDYKPIEEKGGGAVFLLRNGAVVANDKYGKVSIEKEKAVKTSCEGTLYDSFLKNPHCYDYLNNPALLKS